MSSLNKSSHNPYRPKCGCGRKRVSSNLALRYLRRSKVPEGGWTNSSFRSREGRQLLDDMVLVQRKASLDGIKTLTRFLKPKFNELTDRIIQEVMERKARRGERLKEAQFTVNPEGDERLWASAIEDVLGEFNEEVRVQVSPVMQGAATSVYRKTSLLLGVTEGRDVDRRVLSAIRPLATQVTRINDTTRDDMMRVIGDGLDNELPVNEVARNLRDRIGQRFAARIPTIARTEMGRSADLGRAMSLRDSGVVKTVEVIGCQAVEPGIPTYQGRPTCNITGVPVEDAERLEFHPNHTGTIVPETFFEDGETAETSDTGDGGGGTTQEPELDSNYTDVNSSVIPKPARGVDWITETARSPNIGANVFDLEGPEEVNDWLDRLYDDVKSPDTKIYIRVHDQNLRNILDDGRLKSQFETRTSGGALNLDLRVRAESQVFGAAEDLADSKRPIYGYLGKRGDAVAANKSLRQYGDVRISLKDSARKRSTWTYMDSLDYADETTRLQGHASPINDPSVDSLSPEKISGVVSESVSKGDAPDFVSRGYREAQVWDGVSLDDVDIITFQSEPKPSIVRRLEELGINYEVE